jgi:hypothetical protein
MVCEALLHFLDYSGRWDEWGSLEFQAEKKAVEEKDFRSAGWRAEHAGWLHYRRGDTEQVLACAERVEAHWREAKVGDREWGIALRLRGMGHHLAKDYAAAIEAHRQAVDRLRYSQDVRIRIVLIADDQRR